MKDETIEQKVLAVFKGHFEDQGQKIDKSYIATLVKGQSKRLRALCLKEQAIINYSCESETEVANALTNLERRGIVAHIGQGDCYWFVTPLGILFLERQEHSDSLEILQANLAGAILEITKKRVEIGISTGISSMKKAPNQFIVILMLLWGSRSKERALVWEADKTIRVFREPLEYLLERVSKYIPILNKSIMDKLEQNARRRGDLQKAFCELFQYKVEDNITKSWFEISESNIDEGLRTICSMLLGELPKRYWNPLVQFFENCAYGEEMVGNYGRLLELSDLFGGSHWETEWACKVHTILKTLLNE